MRSSLSFRFAVLALALIFSTAAAAADSIDLILGDRITTFFIAANLILCAYFLLRFDRFAVAHGPEILTTVGILGCFLGIAMALLHFDTANVSASVPQLLGAVRTAFWASVTGVFGALLIRLRHRLQRAPIRQDERAPKAASLDDVVTALYALQRNLAGSEEGTLITQLKLMRQEQSDQLTALRGSFDMFAKRMAEDGSKALIDALKEVIADFNAKINEQFGENFKQLNAAVEKLVTWQQQYKEELDRLQHVQQESAANLRTSAESFSVTAQRANEFTKSADSLSSLLTGLSRQYELILTQHKTMAGVLESLRDVAPQFATRLEELADAMKVGNERLQSQLAEVVKNFGHFTQSSSAEMKQLLTDTLKKAQADVNEQLAKGLETMKKSVVTLDTALQDELTKSLETLGRQLASLSEKFVSDYSPLTDRLRELVRAAGQPRTHEHA